jgi:hypothetical protein
MSRTPLLLLALLTPAAALASDDFDPKLFLETKCMGCHDSSVYTRSGRKVQDLAHLHRQVRWCDSNLGTALFNEDMDKLVSYLNDQYYHFGK